MIRFVCVLFVIVFLTFTGRTSALTLGAFENVAPGVLDAWNQSNPENVRGGGFAASIGNGKLWLVSRRLHRPDFKSPWDSAARGGIVSTLKLSNKAWSHKPYDRLDADGRGEKVFSLHGTLFLLTYSTSQLRIAYHKLFFWNDEQGAWSELPLEVDVNPRPGEPPIIVPYEIQALTVTVPKQGGKLAYVVSSAHAKAQRGGEQVYSKLEVEFRGPVPAKATLKRLAQSETEQPSAGFFTAIKDNKLYAFFQTFLSEGYTSEGGVAYVLDLATNRISNVSLGGTAPRVGYNSEAMHQTDNEVLIVGGTRIFGLGQVRKVDEIYSLNLNTKQWQPSSSSIPQGAGRKSVYDQEAKKLYLVGLQEGVKAAQVTST